MFEVLKEECSPKADRTFKDRHPTNDWVKGTDLENPCFNGKVRQIAAHKRYAPCRRNAIAACHEHRERLAYLAYLQ